MQNNRFNVILTLASLITATCVDTWAQSPSDWGQHPKPQAKILVDKAVLQSQQDLNEASILLKTATVEDPNYYRAQRNLGLIRLSQNNNFDAIVELNKALDIQKSQGVKDPTIWSELGFAYDRAEMPEEAEKAFQNGVIHIKELTPPDQLKLLQRGAASYMLRQNPLGAKKLLESARPALDLGTASKVENFITESVVTLTKSDIQEGWVSFGRQSTSGTSTNWDKLLFKKITAGDLPPKNGDNVTPLDFVVNIRADYRRPENKDNQLGTPIGFARPGETFTLIEDPVAVQLGEELVGWTAWWIKIRRDAVPRTP
ncbi:MAG: tetratricopeptide repeat protein [Luteolibacter sp.]